MQVIAIEYPHYICWQNTGKWEMSSTAIIVFTIFYIMLYAHDFTFNKHTSPMFEQVGIFSQNRRTALAERDVKGHVVPTPLPWAAMPPTRSGCPIFFRKGMRSADTSTEQEHEQL